MEFPENVRIQFLGFSANPEYQPSDQLLRIEKQFGGQTFKPDALPEGFTVTPAMLGDYFLKYKDEVAFRIFWIKQKDGKWFNYTLNKVSTPEIEWQNHIKGLPWWHD